MIFEPSTDEVRAAFVKYAVQHSPTGVSAEEAGAAFDSWLEDRLYEARQDGAAWGTYYED